MQRARIADFARIPAFRIQDATAQRVPIVFASGHSGRQYGEAFLATTRVKPMLLRQAEDALVDRLFAPAARAIGAPLLRATFPRTVIDANREPFELDPLLFDGPLPPYARHDTPRVRAGLGTLPRLVGDGEAIYHARLDFAEALARLDRLYLPYHAALARLIETTVARFGACLLVDCHSMPTAIAGHRLAGNRLDYVLSDAEGSSADPRLAKQATKSLTAHGARVAHNDPFTGGFVTRQYGRPDRGVHVLQIEVARDLYLDEATLTPHQGFDMVAALLAGLAQGLARVRLDRPTRAAPAAPPALGLRRGF